MQRILAANSKRTFQIQSSRSQNMPGRILRAADFQFLVTKSGAEAKGLSAQMSQFSFLSSSSRPGRRIWEASHFLFLNSRCKSKDAHSASVQPGPCTILVSDFTCHDTVFQNGPCMQIPNPPVPRFSFMVRAARASPDSVFSFTTQREAWEFRGSWVRA